MNKKNEKVTAQKVTNKGINTAFSSEPDTTQDDKKIGGDSQKVVDLESLLVNRSQRINEPGYLFEIGGTPCLPLEGICAISGEAKKGKSQFLTILEAVLMSGRPFGNIRRIYNTPLKVLHVDTEQTPFDVQCNLDRLCTMAQWDYSTDLQTKNLTYLRMRKLGVSDRLNMLDDAVKEFNPDVIVIDGCRDLIHDFNDVMESGKVIERLMQYADQGKAVWTVIHVNAGTTKMRGHLGTELLNKCADNWNVSRVGDTFQTKHISRSREVTNTPSFKFDRFNLVPCDAVIIPEKETAEQKYSRCAQEIFLEVQELTYEEFDTQLATRSGSSIQTAKLWRKKLMALNVIGWNKQQNIEYTKPF